MHAQPAVPLRRQRARAHPFEPGVALGRVEDALQRVARVRGPHAERDRKQMQIVIAEQRLGRRAEAAHAAQHGQRLRPAVDQIAEQRQAIARRREADLRKQPFESIAAALQVANQEMHRFILLRSAALHLLPRAWTLRFWFS
jgi:hypothetical protein